MSTADPRGSSSVPPDAQPDIAGMAKWLADLEGVSFDYCDAEEREDRLWRAEAILSEAKRRSAPPPSVPGGAGILDVSNDPEHLKTKLRDKRNAIRGLLAKNDRMERAWKGGQTWREFVAAEAADHATKRSEAIAKRDRAAVPGGAESAENRE